MTCATFSGVYCAQSILKEQAVNWWENVLAALFKLVHTSKPVLAVQKYRGSVKADKCVVYNTMRASFDQGLTSAVNAHPVVCVWTVDD